MLLVLLYLQFYFQNGRPPPVELKEQCLSRIDDHFNNHMDGYQIHGEMCFFIENSPICVLGSFLLSFHCWVGELII